MTTQEIITALEAALHDLQTSHGLHVHDGDARDVFTLDNTSIEGLKRAIAALKSADE
jgi:hypothetical protein